jgi:hypothetical protein
LTAAHILPLLSFVPDWRRDGRKGKIYYLIKSYCAGGVGCYYSASSRAETAHL